MKQWLMKHITEKKIVFYTQAQKIYLRESFHSLIYKYVSKQIHFLQNHRARIARATLNWNENRSRECLKVVEVHATNNIMQNWLPQKQILSDKTYNWKNNVKQLNSLNN